MTEKKRYHEDTVAVWKVPLIDGSHEIEFEHGTATGKRIIRLDGKIVKRKDWMFQLVGDEIFDVGNVQCTIRVEPDGLFMYKYDLLIDGKSLESYCEHISKTHSSWAVTTVDGVEHRIVLTIDVIRTTKMGIIKYLNRNKLQNKATMDITVNGSLVTNAMSEFIENGTETHFVIGEILMTIRTEHSGDKKIGVVHSLFVNGSLIPEL